ncbi:MAG: PEGA domain-containing protein, partial [Nitrospinota bacterium]
TDFYRKLKPTRAYGKLAVNALPFAHVFVDDVSKGDTPLVIDRIRVGQHTVRFERPGFHPITKRIEIEPGKVTRLGVQMDEWKAQEP